jgi:hypothetical protein
MKQHVDAGQVESLSSIGRRRWLAWWVGRWIEAEEKQAWLYVTIDDFLYPRPSIGEMIEFLEEGALLSISNTDMVTPQFRWDVRWIKGEGKDDEMRIRETAAELCDALWACVKEALERDVE